MAIRRKYDWREFRASTRNHALKFSDFTMEETMKTWTKPEVREQEVGLEVTSYLPAEIDII
jgi:coenzyme PQQ precursor peptide PqqA